MTDVVQEEETVSRDQNHQITRVRTLISVGHAIALLPTESTLL